MRTSKQMFGGLARDIAERQRLEREEAAIRQRYADEREAHLDAHLTRREVLEAIEAVAHEYGMNGNHDSDLIADAFRKLAKELS